MSTSAHTTAPGTSYPDGSANSTPPGGMDTPRAPARSPWAWIPSLYFAEGIPYVVAMTVSVIMYKRFGISNTDIALYTSWLYLPMGPQAALESVRGHVPDEAVLDHRAAVRDRGCAGERRGHHPAPRLLPDHAGDLLAHGVRIVDPRHRGGRVLHARVCPSTSRRRLSGSAARSTASP